ncbi:MAG: thioredoxin family protein, partial [Planctomycetota bacterium]|nr:thioredoxin family protein [Planctomycetota bacterium]
MSLYVLLLGLLLTPGSQSDLPVVVHFTAPWCAACQKMKPTIKSLQNQGYDIRIVDVTKNE